MTELPLAETLPLETFVMLAMYFTIAVYAIYSGVFYYHWKSYGTNSKITGLTLLTYALVTVPLAIALVSIALIF